MSGINWYAEVLKRQDEIIKDLIELINIKSILDEESADKEAPFGQGIKTALQFILDKAQEEDFLVKNVDNYAGHIQYGAGRDLIGILCHLDVVPAGEDWQSDPFQALIRDGKIFGRGAIDDKGPTIAAFYALKIVKELKLDLKKRIRLIIGTDEESDWRCVDHYFKKEETPTFGFAPDADFPIINAEKGILDLELTLGNQSYRDPELDKKALFVSSFKSGNRRNMVADLATARLKAPNHDIIKVQFDEFKNKYSLSGTATIEEGKNGSSFLILQLEGVSAHALEPDKGVNAGLYLGKFLSDLNLIEPDKQFFNFLTKYFWEDSRGKKLEIAFSDHVSGELTVNVGIFNYNHREGGKLNLTIRYPVTSNLLDLSSSLKSIISKSGWEITEFSNSKPHYVAADNKYLRALQKAYQDQTGDQAELMSTGGGTYARSLENGVAFGALFPNREDVAHQKDEYIFIEDLLKATAIYAQAIYELAN